MTTVLLGLIATTLPALTPAHDVAYDYIEYFETASAMIRDLNHYQGEWKEFCDNFDLEDKYIEMEYGTQKVRCEDVKQYFKDQYQEIGSLAYKIDWQCQQHFNTSSIDLCIKRVERELTRMSTNDVLK